MRRLSRAYYRSKARASMNRARRSIDSRYSSKRTARPATVIGSGLIVVGGMEYPASDVTDPPAPSTHPPTGRVCRAK